MYVALVWHQACPPILTVKPFPRHIENSICSVGFFD